MYCILKIIKRKDYICYIGFYCKFVFLFGNYYLGMELCSVIKNFYLFNLEVFWIGNK